MLRFYILLYKDAGGRRVHCTYVNFTNDMITYEFGVRRC